MHAFRPRARFKNACGSEKSFQGLHADYACNLLKLRNFYWVDLAVAAGVALQGRRKRRCDFDNHLPGPEQKVLFFHGEIFSRVKDFLVHTGEKQKEGQYERKLSHLSQTGLTGIP